MIADGAVWIWNLAQDFFSQARQRLDAYHAKEHLWAVAEALHGAGTPEAKAWVEPLLRKMDQSQVLPMIEDLRQLLPSLEDSLQATRCNGRSTTLPPTRTGWITNAGESVANPSAVARPDPPVANINAGSSAPASSGPRLGMKP